MLAYLSLPQSLRFPLQRRAIVPVLGDQVLHLLGRDPGLFGKILDLIIVVG